MAPFELFVTSYVGPGKVSSYRAQLPGGDSAILTMVNGGGWHLAVRKADGRVEDRGLFGATRDAMCVLESEYGVNRGAG